jgi:hypothetical protein
MSNHAKTPIDYRALRKQVKEKRKARRYVKHPICLDTDLYEQWSELEDQRRQATVASIGRDPEKPDPTARLGDSSNADKISDQIKALEEQIEAASLVAVFVVPTPEQQAERNASWALLGEDEHAKRAAHGVTVARETILQAFDRFLDKDGNAIPPDEYGLEDLKELMEDWAQGQLFGLANEITNKSSEVPELPFSVRRSLLQPH